MSVHPSPDVGDDPPPKAVLFCPGCDTGLTLAQYRDGEDRSAENAEDHWPVTCPDCGTQITARSS